MYTSKLKVDPAELDRGRAHQVGLGVQRLEIAADGHRFGQGLQILQRLGHLIACILEILGHIPDQRFDIDLVGKGIKLAVALGSGEGSKADPAVARRVILAQPVGGG